MKVKDTAVDYIPLVRRMAQLVGTAGDAITAYRLLIREICEITHWPYGESWIPAADQSQLVSGNAFFATDERLNEFYARSRLYAFKPGECAVGTAWQDARPIWIEDIGGSDFARTKLAAEFGIRCALIVPIGMPDHRLGVLVFLAGDAKPLDQPLVDLVTDVTGVAAEVLYRKQLQIDLMNERDRVRQLDEVKEYFLQNMSHELRTPMNGILGLSQILSQADLPADYRNMAELIERSANRLLGVFDKLLSLSMLRSGRSSTVGLHNTDVDVRALIEGIVATYQLQAVQKQLELTYEDRAQRAVVYGNSKLLTQAVEYLVDNAIRFTPVGTVSVIADRLVENGLEYVRIAVADTGIGIPESKHTLVFEDFRQVSEGTKRAYDGSGLSLSLARRIVAGMGGRIDLVSKEGVGSTFSLLVPRARPDADAADDSTAAAGDGRPEQPTAAVAGAAVAGAAVAGAAITGASRSAAGGVVGDGGVARAKRPPGSRPMFLSVEDNHVNQLVLGRVLRDLGEVVHVATGEEALQIAAKSDFDLVLMDINLGEGIDGLEAMKRLRALPKFKHCPIVAVTGYALPGDRERFLDAGFNAYLCKPFSRDQLLATVRASLPD